MTIRIDYELSPEQIQKMRKIQQDAWFHQIQFKNVTTPAHPFSQTLNVNNEEKREVIVPWIRKLVADKTVLDAFCANGIFSFESAFAGARRIVGVDFAPERIEAANFVAEVLRQKGKKIVPEFYACDVYELAERFKQPFDIVIAIGGLYHVADIPYVLKQIRKVTKEKLILQTSEILNDRFSLRNLFCSSSRARAEFIVRRDRRDEGLTSVFGGAWRVTIPCLRRILNYSGFQIRMEKRPKNTRRFPWVYMICE